VLDPSAGAATGFEQRSRRLCTAVSSEGSRFANAGNTARIELNARHCEILEAIGDHGATPEELGFRTRLREFDDLKSAGLIVYWPMGAPPPLAVVGNRTRSGTWNLTAAGMAARGDGPPLRLA
jgi:hypothetical protein